ncbi:NUDIX hydrolase [Actinobacteria bacterium YIM 96077]|uniref:ADP-ribose pyrophosphatase n=1 Tax=Phytoactinopolyspora halophila TaxID=1981511 RepID=A0A329QNE9_9ACTN|nr:NUDIX hydrolase [Phytoactinopolyspora halophila]AYY12985.1 NUDIX hydrolase [Actinobacteria bacterium YIM 96077]RAW13249.1 ADP-ribose pyrophosphatase [Phytoactinopolyspora halophila]
MTPVRHRTDGDGWVECECGQRHWGLYGSAGLLLVDPEHGVLLQHRAEWSHHGGTWGVPGGARASGEPAVDGALREAHEEAGIPPELVRPNHAWVEDHGSWSYTTVIADRAGAFEPYAADAESLAVSWVVPADVDTLPLHPGFAAYWPSIREQMFRQLVLVVDAANVVGSRPDGWWLDRAGAAHRLRTRLAGAPPLPGAELGLPGTYWWPQVHLVVEGDARDIDDEPTSSITVERAAVNGDDTIVAAVAEASIQRPDDHIVVATADRGLRERVESHGAKTLGPRTLHGLITRQART